MSGQTLKRCPSPLHVGDRELPLDRFGPRKDSKSGLKSHCRACISAKYHLDPSGQQRRNRKFYDRHGERVRAERKAAHRANPEYGRRKAREWARANPDRVRENARRWVEANREKVNAYSRAHRARNRGYYRAALLTYRSRQRGNGGQATPKQLKARWDFYAGRCWMCGDEATEIDHVKPVSKGGSSWASNMRPACLPCNRRKKDRWPL